jgi:hypothetical protein
VKANKFSLAVLLTASISASQAYAVDNVRINGFGNVVMGVTSSDDTFLGYDDNPDFSNESLFALQVSSDISDKLSATAQVLGRGSEDFDVNFEWAYLSYKISDSLTLVAGRSRLPLFTYSSSLDVGYTYHWITAPSVVYNVPFNNLDGVKLSKTGYAGGWDYMVDVAFGQFKGTTLGAENRGENTALISGQISNETFTFRSVYGRTTNTIDLANSEDATAQALGNGFDSLEAAGFVDLADSLRIEEDTGEFVGFSVMYDNFDYFIGAEHTEIKTTNTFANDDEAYYVTVGARFGKWTPALTYENFESSGDVKYTAQIAQIASSGLPPEAVAALSGLAIGSQQSQLSDYSIVTASLRYDVTSGMAIKADISKRSDDVDDNQDATLARLAVNFVF